MMVVNSDRNSEVRHAFAAVGNVSFIMKVSRTWSAANMVISGFPKGVSGNSNSSRFSGSG